MAQSYTTGCVHIYVGLGLASPAYLGTSEGFPMVDTQREWDAVMNDISGSKLPFDYVYEGEQAIISTVLTRWNQAVLDVIDTQPNVAGVLGVNSATDTGSMMAQEGLTFQLWLRYGFGAKAAYLGQGLGKHYPQVILLGPDRTESGSRPRKEHRIFQAWRRYDPTIGNFVLRDSIGLDSLPSPD